MIQEQIIYQGQILFRYRGIIPAGLLLLGLVVYYFTFQGHEFFTPYVMVGLISCMVGLFMRIYTVGYSAPNTSGRNTQRQVAHHINMTGLYSILRHPLYVANFMMWVGVCIWVQQLYFLFTVILFFIIFYERILYVEESFMANKFGAHYSDWARKTPIIIPDIDQWQSPGGTFSWKKVLRQEKNGVAAMLIVLFLFELVFQYKKLGRVALHQIDCMIPMLIGVMIYVVLKYLKYNSSLLTTA